MFNGSSRKLQKIKRSYLKERVKQQQQLSEECSRLDLLLKVNSIDEGTHERLRKLLEIGYEEKLLETRSKHGFA